MFRPPFGLQFLAIYVFVASALYLHFRGRVRLSFRQQLQDHSALVAPYNMFVYLFSAVPKRPMLDVADFPQLAILRDNWKVIREEAEQVYELGHIKGSEKHDDVAFGSFLKRGWQRFYLKWYDDFHPSAQSLCPRTVELLRQVPDVHAAMFALLPPGGKLKPHRDPFAGSVRYHLGLVTPNSDACCIWVDGNPYSWRDGQDVAFDETYVHRARNDTDTTRIILFCDVERPLRNRLATAVNRWTIRHIVKITQAANVEGEKVGLVNRINGQVWSFNQLTKRLKRRSKPLYYALKYAVIGGLLAALVFWLPSLV